MRAIIVDEAHALHWREVEDPQPQPDEVRVEIHATALNRADLAQREGHYPPPPGASEILGLEMAGVVAEIGDDARGWQVGDRVCALLPGGGYAETVSVPGGMLMPLPSDWSMAQGAALPEVFFTAFLNLFLEGGLTPGESVLIHGGASGVGTAAIQLARHAGCRVFATAGSKTKTTRCRDLGAELAVNYREDDFVTVCREATDGRGVDLILDMVGADYLAGNVDLLATGGRLVVISTLSGTRAELDLRALMRRRATLKGSTLRARPVEEKIAIKEAFMARFWPALERGDIVTVIDRVFPIREVEAAHDRMRANRNIGKIVLMVR